MNHHPAKFCLPLLVGFLLAGCQNTENLKQANANHVRSDVRQDFGPVDVLKGKFELFPTPDKSAVSKIRQAGYEGRNVRPVVKLRHRSGQIAEVNYFTEVTNNTIGFGRLQYRKSGVERAVVSIDGRVVGVCSSRKPVMNLSNFSYGQPHAAKDGEVVVVGDVVMGPNKLTVVSRYQGLGGQGAMSKFMNGIDAKVWHEYRFGNRVVAQRNLKPEATVEFSRELTPTEELCIVADMNERLVKERLAQAAANTIYVYVPAPH